MGGEDSTFLLRILLEEEPARMEFAAIHSLSVALFVQKKQYERPWEEEAVDCSSRGSRRERRGVRQFGHASTRIPFDQADVERGFELAGPFAGYNLFQSGWVGRGFVG